MNDMISKQMIQSVQGKRIRDFSHENFYKGERPLSYTVVFDSLDKIPGTAVVKADSNTLFLDNGYVVTFGYDNGGMRYFADSSQVEAMKANQKFITGGFLFRFDFEDHSCLVITNNSWTGSFKALPQAEYKPSDKLNPFDPDGFSFAAFKPHFQKNTAVIAVCATANGFMDVERGIIHEALFESGIHPKIKASKLSAGEVECLYLAIRNITKYSRASGGLSGAVDLYGQTGSYEYRISTKTVGRPCPVCGTNIEKGSAFGSSIFYCPICQAVK